MVFSVSSSFENTNWRIVLLNSNDNQHIPVSLGDIVSLGPYINDQDDESREPEADYRLPEIIPILPIRNAVAYPGTVMPLAIGRQRSKRLLEDTTPNESVIGLVMHAIPKQKGPNQRISTRSVRPLHY